MELSAESDTPPEQPDEGPGEEEDEEAVDSQSISAEKPDEEHDLQAQVWAWTKHQSLINYLAFSVSERVLIQFKVQMSDVHSLGLTSPIFYSSSALIHKKGYIWGWVPSPQYLALHVIHLQLKG